MLGLIETEHPVDDIYNLFAGGESWLVQELFDFSTFKGSLVLFDSKWNAEGEFETFEELMRYIQHRTCGNKNLK